MLIEKLNQLEFGWGNFTNSELYYIISNLLDAGDGYDCHELQRLYISRDPRSLYTFVFNLNFVLITDGAISIGTLDLDGDEIEVITFLFTEGQIDPTVPDFNLHELLDGLVPRGVKKIPNPYLFVGGMEKLINLPMVAERERNVTFNLYPDSPLSEEFKQKWDLSNVETFSGEDLSGDYYLIVKPVMDNEIWNMAVYSFIITDNSDDEWETYKQSKVELIRETVTFDSLKEFDLGKSNTITEQPPL